MNRILLSFLVFDAFACYTNAQQNYSANSGCETGSFPASLYTCKEQDQSCQAFLILKSQPPYDSVSTISSLTSSDPAELARINNVTAAEVLQTNMEVIIPVDCSCTGQFYQANTTFHVSSIHETYFRIAKEAYQSLSPCDALMHANPYNASQLQAGMELQVPLRCACPTSNQAAEGTKYLLTYSLDRNENISDLAARFNATAKSMVDANSLQENASLQPSTTILIPLTTRPSSSQTIIRESETATPPVSASSRGKGGSKRKIYKTVGIAAACLWLVVNIFLFTFFLFYRKIRDGAPSKGIKGNRKKALPEDLRVEIASFEQALKVFGFEEIQKATENFSSRNRINGNVYRGDFSGEILAVKKMNSDVYKELNMLKKVNHFNLIKLQGICENHGRFYFVFEYLKNQSLKEWLHKERREETGRSWTKRIQIALDVANGLHYLHSFTKPAYVHKDIKSSNVLLTSDLRAKIANFSLASVVAKETDAAQTTRITGTRGYMAPEYLQTGLVTPKIDVYAFGVVLLELMTGRDAVLVQDGREILLSTAMLSITKGENPEAELSFFLNPALKDSNRTRFALLLVQLSLACLTQDPENRPSMEEVVSTLSKIQTVLQKLGT